MLNESIALFQAFEQAALATVVAWVHAWGGWGILAGMFLESSIVPIPSEAVLVTAGVLGFSPIEVAIWGTIGSTLGSIVGYYIGKKGGRPVLDKIGPYLFVTGEHVERAEKKFSRYGAWTIFVARLIPFIPFKVFSITAGILRFDFRNFVLATFAGTIPRAFLLAWVGEQIVKYRELTWIVLGLIAGLTLVGYALYRIRHKREHAAHGREREHAPSRRK